MILGVAAAIGGVLLLAALMGSRSVGPAGGDRFDIHEGRTPRGVRYAFLAQPFENTVALAFSWWDGFAQARPGQELLGRAGVAWLQAGTERLPEGQFREELRDDQIGLGLGTGNRSTGGWVSAPPDKLDLAAGRLREVLLTPALSERALARLHRRHASSFEQAREMPGTVARSMLIELLAAGIPSCRRRLQPHSGSGAPKRFGRPEVEAWRQRRVRPRHLGGRSRRAFDRGGGRGGDRSCVRRAAGAGRACRQPPGVAFRRDPRTVVIERPVSQTSLVLGAGSSLVWADELDMPLSSIALNAFAVGPSSRLFRTVRDELGASYGSTAALPMLGGAARYLVISSSVDPASAPRALAVIRAEYERFRREGLTGDGVRGRPGSGGERDRGAGAACWPGVRSASRSSAPGAPCRRGTGGAGAASPPPDSRGGERAPARALAGAAAHDGDRRPIGRGLRRRLRGRPATRSRSGAS